MVSNDCHSSLKLYLVSKPEIVLEQTKTNAMAGFIGTIAVIVRGRLADNIDLMIQRQTYRSYEPIDLPTHRFCMEVRIEKSKDMVTTSKGETLHRR